MRMASSIIDRGEFRPPLNPMGPGKHPKSELEIQKGFASWDDPVRSMSQGAGGGWVKSLYFFDILESLRSWIFASIGYEIARCLSYSLWQSSCPRCWKNSMVVTELDKHSYTKLYQGWCGCCLLLCVLHRSIRPPTNSKRAVLLLQGTFPESLFPPMTCTRSALRTYWCAYCILVITLLDCIYAWSLTGDQSCERTSSHRLGGNMISETLQPLLSGFILRYKQIDDGYSHMLTILTSLLVFYGTWRVWTFSINPALYPFDPKVLPYSIPGMWFQKRLTVLSIEPILIKIIAGLGKRWDP